MRADMDINSVDYEILIYDDLHLTFYDSNTHSKVKIVVPEHIAKKLKEELNSKM
ncbi:hypothetical protein LAV35_03775 [Clostridium sporogenes]|uniref:hypothetical protein n=1 Tax=Clostridium sporogenes TaxID=1509 RepID=UPI0015EED9D8|nr:hypothetical protein [Clostridium sporogenes]MBA4509162.1 hypothetical protein [Clostridium sporogenes]MCW6059743.1 hypothetical protein [Clostridium sporogenes]MCW6067304.1 hypothetical protein [Clostridium sporogenes]